MKKNGIPFQRKCQLCRRNMATEAHHLFSQTKLNKKLYPEYIHDRRNIVYLCYECHHNKPIPKFTEQEFCDRMGIKPRSKSGGQDDKEKI